MSFHKEPKYLVYLKLSCSQKARVYHIVLLVAKHFDLPKLSQIAKSALISCLFENSKNVPRNHFFHK